jgi:hypothetical protein
MRHYGFEVLSAMTSIGYVEYLLVMGIGAVEFFHEPDRQKTHFLSQIAGLVGVRGLS